MASRSETTSLPAELTDLFRSLAQALFDTYRPELHYMRGPGPRWRAKHARATPAPHPHPALAYARSGR
jgi:hypothetical protein